MGMPMRTVSTCPNDLLRCMWHQVEQGSETNATQCQSHSQSKASRRDRFSRLCHPRCRYFIGFLLWFITGCCTYAERPPVAADQVHPIPVAPPSQPGWQDRLTNPEAHISFDAVRGFLATVRRSYAETYSQCTPQLHCFPCEGSTRVADVATRTPRVADQTTRHPNAFARAHAVKPASACHEPGICFPDPIGLAGTPVSRYQHTANVFAYHTSPGTSRCRAGWNATGTAELQCHVNRISKPDRTTRFRSNGFRFRPHTIHSASQSSVACTDMCRHATYANDSPARKLDMAATDATGAQCFQPSIPSQCCEHSFTRDAICTCIQWLRTHNAVHWTDRNRSNVANYATRSGSTTSCHGGSYCTASPPHITGRCRGTIADRSPPEAIAEICRAADEMPAAIERDVTISQDRSNVRDPDPAENSNSRASQDSCRCCFHCQFTRSSKSQSRQSTNVFAITVSQQTTEGFQGHQWCCARSARSQWNASQCYPCLSVSIRKICDTSPHRGSVRNRKRVGLACCQGQDGPPAPYAARPRTSFDSDASCSQLRIDSSCASPVVLSLDRLLSFNAQDCSLAKVDELFAQLRQPWPSESLIWSLDFLNELPDLHPALRQMLQQLDEWDENQANMVTAVHLYVDGSSFMNRQTQQYTCAAWACIIIAEQIVEGNARHMFYAAMSHPMSSACMSSDQFCGVGEVINDPTSAEASGMIVAMSWVIQSTFLCPHFIHYDNCTVGGFADGKSQWNVDWEHIHLKQNISGLRHCMLIAQVPVTYCHVKAHEGHPCNEAADALAKATAKQIIPPSR